MEKSKYRKEIFNRFEDDPAIKELLTKLYIEVDKAKMLRYKFDKENAIGL